MKIDETIENARQIENDLRSQRAFMRDFIRDVIRLMRAPDEPARDYYAQVVQGRLMRNPFTKVDE